MPSSMSSTEIYKWLAFVAGGAINSAVTFVIYQLVLIFLDYWIAFTIAFALGIAFSLFYNAKAVFGASVNASRAIRFCLLYLVQYGVSLGLLSCLVDGFDISAIVAPFFVMAAIVPCTFYAQRLIFSTRPPR